MEQRKKLAHEKWEANQNASPTMPIHQLTQIAGVMGDAMAAGIAKANAAPGASARDRLKLGKSDRDEG